MHYIHEATGEYPISEQQMRARHPATIFPVPFEPAEGYAPVAPADPPAHDSSTHKAVEQAPKRTSGKWRQRWAVEPLSEAEAHDMLAAMRAELTATATAHRWQVETGGITLGNGARIGTTLDDQNRITSVIANAQLAGVASVDFKAASGWESLTLAEVQGIAAAIAIHVQSCFSAERSHHNAIEALATLEQANAYDVSAGWPVQPFPPL